MTVIYYNIFLILCLSFIISLCYTQRNDKGNKLYDLYILFVLFLLSVFCAFRGDTPDTLQYYYYYQTTPDLTELLGALSSGRWFFSVEPFFHLFMSIEKTVFGSYELFLFLLTFFSLWIVYKAYSKYTEKSDIALIIFLSLSFIFLYFVQIRQGVSIAMTLLGVTYFYEGKKYKGFFCLLASMMVHVSTIVIFPMFILMRLLNINFLIIITPILVVVFNVANIVPKLFIEVAKLINFPLLTTKIDLYFISGVKEHTVSLFSIINLLTLLVLFVCWTQRSKMISYFKSEKIYVWSQFYTACSVISYNMFPLAQDVGSRFYKQLNIFMPLQIAFMIDAIILSRKNSVNIFFRIIIIIFLLLYFYREAFNFKVY